MSREKTIPYGFCHCGCGRKTNIATENSKEGHYLRGEPRRFLAGHSHRIIETIEQRFWSKVQKGHSPNDCWKWASGKTKDGYGTIGRHKGNIYVHRYSYELHYGPIPEGMLVCHHCDFPECSNPKHLWLGTHADNVQDKMNKGRHNSGGRKITEKDVREIRKLYVSRRVTYQFLADKYSVSLECARRVVLRITWKNIE